MWFLNKHYYARTCCWSKPKRVKNVKYTPYFHNVIPNKLKYTDKFYFDYMLIIFMLDTGNDILDMIMSGHIIKLVKTL